MNVYLFELKMYKKSIIIWSAAIAFWIIFYMAFYPLIGGEGVDFDSIMSKFPKEFSALFGINNDLPVSSVLGYFSLTFSMAQIPIAIQAANYGFSSLSIEERELTADFLLSKPIKRETIIISKFLAALTSLMIVNVFIWISSIVAINMFKGDNVVSFDYVYILLSSVIFFQLFFLSLGMAISVLIKKINSVLSFSMAFALGLYVVNSFALIFSSDVLGYISPYSHFNPSYILVEGHYHPIYTVISILVIIVSLFMSYFLYLRRNIHSL